MFGDFLFTFSSLQMYHKDCAVGPFFCTAATKALAMAGHGNSWLSALGSEITGQIGASLRFLDTKVIETTSRIQILRLQVLIQVDKHW